MFQQHIKSISVPVVCPFEGLRPTVAALLITPQDGIVLVHSAKADRGQWSLLQGGIEAGETLLEALEREAGEELPGTELILTGTRLFGDCINEMPVSPPRDSPDKWMCVVAVPIKSLPQRYNPDEIDDLCEVRSGASLMPMLQMTRPKKREIIYHAVSRARHFGLLTWNASPIPLAA